MRGIPYTPVPDSKLLSEKGIRVALPAAKQVTRRLLLLQVVITLLLAAAGGLLNIEVALSALLGGAIVLCANLIFAVIVFAPYRAQQPGRVLSGIYLAELMKLAFVGGCFAAVFVWLQWLNVVALLVAFFIVQVVSALFAQMRSGGNIT